MTTDLPVSLADVQAAHLRIAAHIHRTPVVTSRLLDARAGCRVFCKCENLQRIGAFKARGAFSRMTLLSADERRRGVVAYSSGNHAQAVALAAAELGIRATIVMPADAPAAKLAATRGYGARVITYDRVNEDREAIARQIMEDEGSVMVPPFDDDAIIAGQGTLALELLEEVPDLDVLVSPCSGGGLLSGIAIAGRGLRPGLRVFGVEPEAGDDVKRGLAAGHPVSIPVPETIADALQTSRPADRTFAVIQALVEGVVTVTDLELRQAMAFAISRLKLVVEPGGVAALAAVLYHHVPEIAGRRVGVVLSGGNVDPGRLGELLSGIEI